MAETNPYQAPMESGMSSSSLSSGYFLIPSPRGLTELFKKNAALELVQQHGERGERLIAACSEGSNRNYYIFKSPQTSEVGQRKYSYQFVQPPRAKALKKFSSGTLSEFMAHHFPKVEPGWIPVAYIFQQNLVLGKVDEYANVNRDELLVARVQPAWWNSVFGDWYERAIAQKLTAIGARGYAVITYLGHDYYLLSKQPQGTDHPSYKMTLAGNTLRALFLGFKSACEKRIAQEVENGWELVTCHFSFFLFSRHEPNAET